MEQNEIKNIPLLSIVAPAYNEEDVLNDFYHRITQAMNGLELNYEIIYINDGSSDKSIEIMLQQREQDNHIAIIDLSRNFGKEIALTAGLDYSSGDAVIIIDVDLQDPPELIPELIKYWFDGYDVVSAKRTKRHGEGLLKKFSSFMYYRFLYWLSDVKIPRDTGDFRLINRQAVNALLRLRESHRYMKGLFAWVGFSHMDVDYERDPRIAGKTKWNYWSLINLAFDGLTSFSVAPLRMASYIGLLTAIIAFAFGFFILIKKMLFGDPVSGYPSLVVIITFLGGVQLIALGIIGEYLGRVFNETKNRPLYLVKDIKSSVFSTQDTQSKKE